MDIKKCEICSVELTKEPKKDNTLVRKLAVFDDQGFTGTFCRKCYKQGISVEFVLD